MTKRPVFMAHDKWPYYRTAYVDFDWNPGFAVSQKRKNITAMHIAFRASYPESNVLEISSKSMQEHGEDLSAFFLKKFVPQLNEARPVECVFQAGKVFENGGPYEDILLKAPREAKRDDRLKTSGKLVCFKFDGTEYPLEPKTLFYDHLYINALLENPELITAVMKYDAFTDVEFNPTKSINCQAKAAAVFVSLSRLGLLSKVKDLDSFKEIMIFRPKKTVEEKEEVLPEIDKGTVIVHKTWGEGTVWAVSGSVVVVDFGEIGSKKLGLDWVRKNCTIK